MSVFYRFSRVFFVTLVASLSLSVAAPAYAFVPAVDPDPPTDVKDVTEEKRLGDDEDGNDYQRVYTTRQKNPPRGFVRVDDICFGGKFDSCEGLRE